MKFSIECIIEVKGQSPACFDITILGIPWNWKDFMRINCCWICSQPYHYAPLITLLILLLYFPWFFILSWFFFLLNHSFLLLSFSSFFIFSRNSVLSKFKTLTNHLKEAQLAAFVCTAWSSWVISCFKFPIWLTSIGIMWLKFMY